jgi:hypothetical protein
MTDINLNGKVSNEEVERILGQMKPIAVSYFSQKFCGLCFFSFSPK